MDIQIQDTQRTFKYDEYKAAQIKKYYNQTVKNQRQKLQSSKRKATCYIQGRSHKVIITVFSADTLQARVNGLIYSKG